jgi:outer membrane receptor protein involved in Fe transport
MSPFHKTLPLLLTIVLTTGIAEAQVTFTGHVTDPEQRPIPDAVIAILEQDVQALTDSSGAFEIKDVRPGTYTITIHRTGFAPETRTEAINTGTVLDITLHTTPFAMEPVVVVASRAPISPDQSPLPTNTLSGDQLRRNHTVSLAHSLEELPGVRALTTGGQVGKPVIRGMTGPRVLVLEDENRLEDYSWSDEDGPSVDARLADRVEVVRGPASLLYGSDALGGAVNAIPRSLPDPRETGLTHFGIEAYGASNNREFGSAFLVEGAHRPIGWRLFVVGRAAEDLNTPDGKLENTGFSALNGEAVVGTRDDKGDVQLRYARYGGEFKLLEAEGPANEEEEGGPERKTSDNRVQLTAKRLIGGLRWEFHGQWQGHSLIEVADEPGTTTESEQFNLQLSTFSGDLLAHFGKGGTAGISGMFQSNDSKGPIPLVPDADTKTGGLFVIEQLHTGSWDLSGGVRGDVHHLKADANPDLAFAGDTQDASSVSANLGAVYHLSSSWSLRGNVGNAWRAPTLLERYANGPRLSEARYEIGQNDLDNETGVTFDAGLHLEASKVHGELSAFASKYSSFIYLASTGQTQDSLSVYRYQQADATLLGGEAALEVEVAGPLMLHGRADYVRGDNDDLDEPLPLIPPLRGFVGGDLRFSKLSWADAFEVGAEAELVDRQDRLSAFDTATDGYTLFHAHATLNHDFFGRGFRIDLTGRNLGDTSYRDFMSRYKGFALDQGRNIILRISTGL